MLIVGRVLRATPCNFKSCCNGHRVIIEWMLYNECDYHSTLKLLGVGSCLCVENLDFNGGIYSFLANCFIMLYEFQHLCTKIKVQIVCERIIRKILFRSLSFYLVLFYKGCLIGYCTRNANIFSHSIIFRL